MLSYSIVHSECHFTEVRRVESECCLMLALDCCSCTAVGHQLKQMAGKIWRVIINFHIYLKFSSGRSASCVTGSLDVFGGNQVLVTGKTFCLFVCLSVWCEWLYSSTYCTDCAFMIYTFWMPGTQVSLRLLAKVLGQTERKQYCFSFELGWSERGGASWEISGLFLELAWEFRRRSPRKIQLLQVAMKYILLWCGEFQTFDFLLLIHLSGCC